MNADDQLARLRVAMSTGRLPHDLGTWVYAQIVAAMGADERRARRDALLLAAGEAIGGTVYRRAKRVHELLEHFREFPGHLHVGYFRPGTPEAFVQQAMRVYSRCPTTRRQLLTILGGMD